MKPTILIVDDEKLLLQSLSKVLLKCDYNILTSPNAKNAITTFKKNNIDLVLLDVKLPDMDGMEVLKKIKKMDPLCPTIVMTAFSGIQGAVEAIKLGAYDYIAKPFDIEELKFIVGRCIESEKVAAEVRQLKAKRKERYSFDNILTDNIKMKQLIRLIKKVASTDQSNILLLGESGTGKELFANAIHYNGLRADNPITAVNCGALSEGVLESELFGHEKGSFTGAIRQKKGLFEIAHGGTLFLDEIGEISPKTQVKILRFLEEKTFQRVGGTQEIEVDVRIIAATNKNLLKEVNERRFREDLYYRLNVISFTIPPLRNRREDIPLLINHFTNYFNKTLNKNVKGCDNDALNILLSYEWPGNVREVRNVIERVILLSDDDLISSTDLPQEMVNHLNMQDRSIMEINDPRPLDKFIKLYAKSVLAKCDDNKSETARVLEITRQRLKRILNH